MTRALMIQGGVAVVALAAGVTLLARPGVVRGVSGEARYGLRIAGMMLVALGVFLGGFALMLWGATTV